MESNVSDASTGSNEVYHVYVKVSLKSGIEVHVHPFVHNSRRNVTIIGGEIDYVKILGSQKILLLFDEKTTVILYMKIHLDEIDWSLIPDFHVISKSSLSVYHHQMRYIDRIHPKTFILIERIGTLIREQLMKLDFLQEKQLKCISVSDVHGDIILFLLPLFLSESISNLKVDENLSFNIHKNNCIFIGNGDYFAQSVSQYVRDTSSETYKFLNEERKPYDELIEHLIHIFNYETKFQRLNAHFIMGNHDRILLTNSLDIRIDDDMKRTLFNSIRSFIIDNSSFIIKNGDIDKINILKWILDGRYWLLHDKLDNKALIDCLNISICLKFDGRMYLFQHAPFGEKLPKTLISLKFPSNCIYEKPDELLIFPLLQTGINLKDLTDERTILFTDNKFNYDESIQYFLKRFISFGATYSGNINIILGHHAGYSLMNQDKYSPISIVNIPRVGKIEMRFFNDNLFRAQQPEDQFKSIMNNHENGTIYDSLICLDGLNNSLMNTYLQSFRNNETTPIHFPLTNSSNFKGGNKKSQPIFKILICLLLFLSLILIVIQIFSQPHDNNKSWISPNDHS